MGSFGVFWVVLDSRLRGNDKGGAKLGSFRVFWRVGESARLNRGVKLMEARFACIYFIFCGHGFLLPGVFGVALSLNTQRIIPCCLIFVKC